LVGFAGGSLPQNLANILMVKNISAIGLYWGTHRKFDPDSVVRSFKETFDWILSG
jgi:NADPH2:quinone reductase